MVVKKRGIFQKIEWRKEENRQRKKIGKIEEIENGEQKKGLEKEENLG